MLTADSLSAEMTVAPDHHPVDVRRILAERVLRLVSLSPMGVQITHVLQADRILDGPLVKLAPETLVSLVREMLENDYLRYVPGTVRLALAPAYQHFQQTI